MSSPEGRGLLETWLKRTREAQIAHYAAEEQNARRHMYVGLPATILSAIVGTAVFTSLDAEAGLDVGLRILVGAIAIITAILTGCQTFLRFSDKAEMHRTTAVKYAGVRRSIEHALSFPETITQALAADIKASIDAIGEAAPNVPQGVWTKALEKAGNEYFIPGKP